MNADDEIRGTDSRILWELADQLKADAKALYEDGHYRDEALRLFRLYRRIREELHRRANPAIAYRWN